MSDDPVKKMNKNIAELFLRHEIERKDAAIAELTEALKRDVIDETRNAELNNAKDAAIAELVLALKPFSVAYKNWDGGQATEHFSKSVMPGDFRFAADISAKYDNTTKET